jgi:hypothetical protein
VWACGHTKPVSESAELLSFLQGLAERKPGATISGSVRSSTRTLDERERIEEGIAGARVFLAGAAERSANTDADGKFRFADLPAGDYRLTTLLPEQRRDLAALAPHPLRLASPHACAEVSLTTSLDGRIEGTVFDDTGQPVPGVGVDIRAAGPHTRDRSPEFDFAQTDDAGRYLFEGLAPGRYVVGLNLASGPRGTDPFEVAYASSASGRQVLEVAAGALTIAGPIRAHRLEERTLNGRTVWADGTPAAYLGVEVTPTSESGRLGWGEHVCSDAQGLFQAQVLGAVRYRVEVNSSDHSVDVDVEPARQAGLVVLRLPSESSRRPVCTWLRQGHEQ